MCNMTWRSCCLGARCTSVVVVYGAFSVFFSVICYCCYSMSVVDELKIYIICRWLAENSSWTEVQYQRPGQRFRRQSPLCRSSQRGLVVQCLLWIESEWHVSGYQQRYWKRCVVRLQRLAILAETHWNEDQTGRCVTCITLFYVICICSIWLDFKYNIHSCLWTWTVETRNT